MGRDQQVEIPDARQPTQPGQHERLRANEHKSLQNRRHPETDGCFRGMDQPIGLGLPVFRPTEGIEAEMGAGAALFGGPASLISSGSEGTLTASGRK